MGLAEWVELEETETIIAEAGLTEAGSFARIFVLICIYDNLMKEDNMLSWSNARKPVLTRV
jgi:hypothetical protein